MRPCLWGALVLLAVCWTVLPVHFKKHSGAVNIEVDIGLQGSVGTSTRRR